MAITVDERWTCRICTSANLDGQAHAFCPDCGHERDVDESRLPTWEEFLSPPFDRFAGAAEVCCGSSYGSDARFCGCCGASLASAMPPRTPPPRFSLVGLSAVVVHPSSDGPAPFRAIA